MIRRARLAVAWLSLAGFLALAHAAPRRAQLRAAEPRSDAADAAADAAATEFDELRTEVVARLAELERELGAASPPARERVAELCTDTFRSRGLVAASTSVLRDDADLRIERGTVGERVLEGVDGATEAFDALAERWRGASALRVELELVTVRPRAESVVRFAARWRAADGLHQLGADWTCTWSDTQPRKLIALDVAGLEQVRARRPWFEDATEAALGASAAWRDDLRLGADHWAVRIDRSLGEPLLAETGLAVGDANGDGEDDLYVCRPGGLPNRLFLRTADGRAREAASEAGLDFLDSTRAALFLDLDDDGDQDLAATIGDELVLARNDGKGRFELAARLAVPDASGLAAADVERDGDLDLYVACYRAPDAEARVPFPIDGACNGFRNVLLRCEAPFRYVDATRESGLESLGRRFTRSAVFEDYDDDGDADLFVAIDFGDSAFFRNEAGRFERVSASSKSSASASWSDFDGDGDLDLLVSGRADFTATLFANGGNGTLADVTRESGVSAGGWCLGALFVDVDGDGREDLVLPRGYVTGSDPSDVLAHFGSTSVGSLGRYTSLWTGAFAGLRAGRSWHGRERNRVVLNVGAAGLADVSGVSGLDFADDARATARCDWNGDGRVDLWLQSRGAPGLRLVLGSAVGEAAGDSERGGAGEGAAFELELVGGARNRDAIGARVELVVAGDARRRIAAVRAGEGYLAQSTKRLFFAVARDARVERAIVRWPDGERETFEGLSAPGRWRLARGTGRAEPRASAPVAPATSAFGSGANSGSTSSSDSSASAGSKVAATSDSDIATSAGSKVTQGSGSIGAQGSGSNVATGANDGHLTLAARPPLPPLKALDPAGATRKFGALARPLAVLLWRADSAPSLAALRGLALASADARPSGFDLVALSLDDSTRRQDAADALASVGWAADSAFAEHELAARVELLLRALTERGRRLTPPTLLVVDRENRVVAVDRGECDLATLLRDVAHAARPESELRELATPFPGRWLGSAPKADLLSLARAFEAAGFADAARLYELAHAARLESSGANALFARGVAELDAQRFDAAGELFERALRADPAHFEALGALAYSLQARSRVVEAIAVYRRALALRPRDSATRYNLILGFAQHAEAAAAASELYLLRALDPNAAEELRVKMGW
ncbi:MAG: VCBS repeat-containing protein [Planctomycetes bacterium]|nr:VCBS repeat-containing protein [Planctomycetota bacterium]